MAKDILSMYGRDAPMATKQVARTTCGGDMTRCVKPLPYDPPWGPKGQMHNGPGLGDRNLGNAVMQGKH